MVIIFFDCFLFLISEQCFKSFFCLNPFNCSALHILFCSMMVLTLCLLALPTKARILCLDSL